MPYQVSSLLKHMLDDDKNYDNDDDAFMILPTGSDAKQVSLTLGEGGIYKRITFNSFSKYECANSCMSHILQTFKA